MLLYLSNGHIFLWFGDKPREIDGGDWGVILWPICQSKNFFSRQGTCGPLETSATLTSVMFAEFYSVAILVLCEQFYPSSMPHLPLLKMREGVPDLGGVLTILFFRRILDFWS